MRQKRNMMVMAIVAMLSLTMTSCNIEDEFVADDLQGTWYGSVKNEYFNYRYGYTTEWTEVQMEFFKDPFVFAEGSGREIDYCGRQYSSIIGFNYHVRNQVIYIDYYDGTKIAIYNYSLRSSKFSGEFHDYHTGEFKASFNLNRMSNGWEYGYSKIKEGITDQVITIGE